MRRVFATLLLAGLVLGVASAPGGTPTAVNLIATAKVKAALRTAFVHAHKQYAPSKIKGPLKGTTYYGRYGQTKYAFATFSVPRTGTTDQPELFKRPSGRVWRDLGDTGGEICKRDVPLPLIKVWKLKPGSAGCYYAP